MENKKSFFSANVGSRKRMAFLIALVMLLTNILLPPISASTDDGNEGASVIVYFGVTGIDETSQSPTNEIPAGGIATLTFSYLLQGSQAGGTGREYDCDNIVIQIPEQYDLLTLSVTEESKMDIQILDVDYDNRTATIGFTEGGKPKMGSYTTYQMHISSYVEYNPITKETVKPYVLTNTGDAQIDSADNFQLTTKVLEIIYQFGENGELLPDEEQNEPVEHLFEEFDAVSINAYSDWTLDKTVVGNAANEITGENGQRYRVIEYELTANRTDAHFGAIQGALFPTALSVTDQLPKDAAGNLPLLVYDEKGTQLNVSSDGGIEIEMPLGDPAVYQLNDLVSSTFRYTAYYDFNSFIPDAAKGQSTHPMTNNAELVVKSGEEKSTGNTAAVTFNARYNDHGIFPNIRIAKEFGQESVSLDEVISAIEQNGYYELYYTLKVDNNGQFKYTALVSDLENALVFADPYLQPLRINYYISGIEARMISDNGSNSVIYVGGSDILTGAGEAYTEDSYNSGQVMGFAARIMEFDKDDSAEFVVTMRITGAEGAAGNPVVSGNENEEGGEEGGTPAGSGAPFGLINMEGNSVSYNGTLRTLDNKATAEALEKDVVNAELLPIQAEAADVMTFNYAIPGFSIEKKLVSLNGKTKSSDLSSIDIDDIRDKGKVEIKYQVKVVVEPGDYTFDTFEIKDLGLFDNTSNDDDIYTITGIEGKSAAFNNLFAIPDIIAGKTLTFNAKAPITINSAMSDADRTFEFTVVAEMTAPENYVPHTVTNTASAAFTSRGITDEIESEVSFAVKAESSVKVTKTLMADTADSYVYEDLVDGDEFTYEITVTNNGQKPADIGFTDKLGGLLDKYKKAVSGFGSLEIVSVECLTPTNEEGKVKYENVGPNGAVIDGTKPVSTTIKNVPVNGVFKFRVTVKINKANATAEITETIGSLRFDNTAEGFYIENDQPKVNGSESVTVYLLPSFLSANAAKSFSTLDSKNSTTNANEYDTYDVNTLNSALYTIKGTYLGSGTAKSYSLIDLGLDASFRGAYLPYDNPAKDDENNLLNFVQIERVYVPDYFTMAGTGLTDENRGNINLALEYISYDKFLEAYAAAGSPVTTDGINAFKQLLLDPRAEGYADLWQGAWASNGSVADFDSTLTVQGKTVNVASIDVTGYKAALVRVKFSPMPGRVDPDTKTVVAREFEYYIEANFADLNKLAIALDAAEKEIITIHNNAAYLIEFGTGGTGGGWYYHVYDGDAAKTGIFSASASITKSATSSTIALSGINGTSGTTATYNLVVTNGPVRQDKLTVYENGPEYFKTGSAVYNEQTVTHKFTYITISVANGSYAKATVFYNDDTAGTVYGGTTLTLPAGVKSFRVEFEGLSKYAVVTVNTVCNYQSDKADWKLETIKNTASIEYGADDNTVKKDTDYSVTVSKTPGFKMTKQVKVNGLDETYAASKSVDLAKFYNDAGDAKLITYELKYENTGNIDTLANNVFVIKDTLSSAKYRVNGSSTETATTAVNIVNLMGFKEIRVPVEFETYIRDFYLITDTSATKLSAAITPMTDGGYLVYTATAGNTAGFVLRLNSLPPKSLNGLAILVTMQVKNANDIYAQTATKNGRVSSLINTVSGGTQSMTTASTTVTTSTINTSASATVTFGETNLGSLAAVAKTATTDNNKIIYATMLLEEAQAFGYSITNIGLTSGKGVNGTSFKLSDRGIASTDGIVLYNKNNNIEKLNSKLIEVTELKFSAHNIDEDKFGTEGYPVIILYTIDAQGTVAAHDTTFAWDKAGVTITQSGLGLAEGLALFGFEVTSSKVPSTFNAQRVDVAGILKNDAETAADISVVRTMYSKLRNTVVQSVKLLNIESKNEAAAEITVDDSNLPDFKTVTKKANPTTVTSWNLINGDVVIKYTIGRFTNDKKIDATNIVVTDNGLKSGTATFPYAYEITDIKLTGAAGLGESIVNNGKTFTVTVPVLKPGESFDVEYTVTIKQLKDYADYKLHPVTAINNSFTLSYEPMAPNGNKGGSSTVNVTDPKPTPAITKLVSPASGNDFRATLANSIAGGTSVQYKITAYNNSATPIVDPSIIDALPWQFDVNSITGIKVVIGKYSSGGITADSSVALAQASYSVKAYAMGVNSGSMLDWKFSGVLNQNEGIEIIYTVKTVNGPGQNAARNKAYIGSRIQDLSGGKNVSTEYGYSDSGIFGTAKEAEAVVSFSATNSIRLEKSAIGDSRFDPSSEYVKYPSSGLTVAGGVGTYKISVISGNAPVSAPVVYDSLPAGGDTLLVGGKTELRGSQWTPEITRIYVMSGTQELKMGTDYTLSASSQRSADPTGITYTTQSSASFAKDSGIGSIKIEFKTNLPAGKSFDIYVEVLVPEIEIPAEYAGKDFLAVNSAVLKTSSIAGGSSISSNSAALRLAEAVIGDYVWNDVDRDGVQDADEPGVEGIEVRLFKYDDVYDNNGAMKASGQALLDSAIGTQRTNASGHYEFRNIIPNTHKDAVSGLVYGKYTVAFGIPDGSEYVFTHIEYAGDSYAEDSQGDTSKVANTSQANRVETGDGQYIFTRASLPIELSLSSLQDKPAVNTKVDAAVNQSQEVTLHKVFELPTGVYAHGRLDNSNLKVVFEISGEFYNTEPTGNTYVDKTFEVTVDSGMASTFRKTITSFNDDETNGSYLMIKGVRYSVVEKDVILVGENNSETSVKEWFDFTNIDDISETIGSNGVLDFTNTRKAAEILLTKEYGEKIAGVDGIEFFFDLYQGDTFIREVIAQCEWNEADGKYVSIAKSIGYGYVGESYKLVETAYKLLGGNTVDIKSEESIFRSDDITIERIFTIEDETVVSINFVNYDKSSIMITKTLIGTKDENETFTFEIRAKDAAGGYTKVVATLELKAGDFKLQNDGSYLALIGYNKLMPGDTYMIVETVKSGDTVTTSNFIVRYMVNANTGNGAAETQYFIYDEGNAPTIEITNTRDKMPITITKEVLLPAVLSDYQKMLLTSNGGTTFTFTFLVEQAGNIIGQFDVEVLINENATATVVGVSTDSIMVEMGVDYTVTELSYKVGGNTYDINDSSGLFVLMSTSVSEQNATVTNALKTGLIIRKVVEGIRTTEAFTFDIFDITDGQGVVVATVAASAGESVMVTGLVDGRIYEVRERTGEGFKYTVSYSASTNMGEAVPTSIFEYSGENSTVVTVTNTAKQGKIVLSKELVLNSVVASNWNGRSFVFEITGDGGYSNTVVLTDTEKLVTLTVPYGKYVVTEVTEGYSTTYVLNGGEVIESMTAGLTIDSAVEATLAFTNSLSNYSPLYPPGNPTGTRPVVTDSFTPNNEVLIGPTLEDLFLGDDAMSGIGVPTAEELEELLNNNSFGKVNPKTNDREIFRTVINLVLSGVMLITVMDTRKKVNKKAAANTAQ